MDSLCAIHMMHPTTPSMEQSVTVIGGIALCLDHAHKTIEALHESQPMTQIIMQALAGEF